MSYWVAVAARNASEHLPRTLTSLLSQSLRPERIIVVDDGSTDQTPDLLKTYEQQHEGTIKILTLPDRGFDIRRVPSNINGAWKDAEDSGLKSDFFMISGDDCCYAPNYTEFLVSRMRADHTIVVASGRPSSSREGFSREHSPSGSGRMVDSRFWREVGSEYPVRAGWETWLLYAASQKGLKVRLFDDVVFDHLQPRGTRHQFAYWGAAMQTLGYHPLYALGRIAKNAVSPTIAPRRAVNMIRGYLEARLGSNDSFLSPFNSSLRSFVYQQQAYRIASIVESVGRR
ncbi:MAG: glycosyltransferase family A protein [Candidatus Bathyarchaeia archaeon]